MIALIRNWILYLLALCGFCAFAINYTAWFSSFMFYLVLVLPFFSLIMMIWPLVSLKLRFESPVSVHRGDAAELLITPKASVCPYYLPVTVFITQTRLGETESHPKRVRYRFIPYPSRNRGSARSTGGIHIPLETTHTAVVRTTILRIYMTDFLGLFIFPLPKRKIIISAKTAISVGQTASDAVHGSDAAHNPFETDRSIDTVVLPHTKKPQNRMRMWDTGNAMLMPTSRTSEQYEIREYRPGDILRSVHWKLSAKTDELLVREAVEPFCRMLAVTVDRPRDPDAADAVYDALDWVLRTLCVKEHAFCVMAAWVNEAGRTCTETIRDIHTLDAFYLHILSDGIPNALSPHAFASVYKTADRGFHLDAAACAGRYDENTQ